MEVLGMYEATIIWFLIFAISTGFIFIQISKRFTKLPESVYTAFEGLIVFSCGLLAFTGIYLQGYERGIKENEKTKSH